MLNYVDAVECLNHLALAYENISDYDNARQSYKRAIRLLEAPTGLYFTQTTEYSASEVILARRS